MKLPSASIFLTLSSVLANMATAAPPQTRKQEVTDTHHGVRVTEHYRWLEDAKNPAVKKWSAAQNAQTRQYLDKLPNVKAVRARVREILAAKTVSFSSVAYRGGRLFAIKRQPPRQQPFLIVLPSWDKLDEARVLVDPNKIDPQGHTSIDWYVPSPDGRHVAVSMSRGGTESGDVTFYEVASGRPAHETIPRVNGGTAGGDLAWSPDGTGVFYTRYPRGKERPAEDMNFFQQLYYHALGTPAEKDRYELGQGLPRIAEVQLTMHHASGRLLATVQDGDGGEFAHFLRSPEGKWRQFSTFGDRTVQATFGARDDLYVVTRKDAPRGRILRVPIEALEVTGAKTVINEGEDNVVTDFMGPPTVLATDSRLYVVYQLGGPSEIRVFDLDGKPLAAPRQLDVSTVGELIPAGGDDLLFRNGSFVEPSAMFHFDAKTRITRRTAVADQSPVRLDDVRVVREMAVSKDGTKVPVNLILPRGLLRDGSNPCVVTGYGGYGISIEPSVSPVRRVLLEQGVIFAVANLRGGGEFGETWHRQGNLTNKQNVFDDFAGVLEHLIRRKYTSPRRLAIIGGSNGGLLMGATMTQHPDLVRAVVSHVGIYDMLRVELSPNGAFNIPEFGTVKNADHFRALRAYSPYHNVTDGARCPATLFLTGENDPRVDPMQSRKMTARLQAATASEAPILLRTSADSGHGGDTSLAERIDQSTDVYSFLLDQLGVRYHFAPSSK